MVGTVGHRQHQLLELLLKTKSGLTVDELAEGLSITRTAVNQHIAGLERDGYVIKADLQKTGGRPGRLYVLTQRGSDLFPKQYSWFSNLLLDTLKQELGSAGLTRYLHNMAVQLSLSLRPRMEGKNKEEKVAEVARIMSELHYEARVSSDEAGDVIPGIEAKNCVYHHLAQQHPEMCQFDLSLLAEVLQADVEHQECIVRGGGACRFKFHEKAQEAPQSLPLPPP